MACRRCGVLEERKLTGSWRGVWIGFVELLEWSDSRKNGGVEAGEMDESTIVTR